jgi:hypothetical protein
MRGLVVGKDECGLVAKRYNLRGLSLSYEEGNGGKVGLWKTIVHDNWGT